MYEIIATGSSGNAILYNKQIMVDCGISYHKIQPYLKSIRLILMTHRHRDHLNPSTVRRIAIERPTLRFACGEWLADELVELGVKNIDILDPNEIYDYGIGKVSLFELYHDEKNCGWRIFLNNGYKIFHATDTFTLDGITAKGYNLYMIESNHDEVRILADIAAKQALGLFAYEISAMNSHLSFQKMEAFIAENADKDAEVIGLHVSKRYLEKP